MFGSEILVSAHPQGRFIEGPISGTPKPGTVMQIKGATALDANGNFTWQVYDRAADGNRPQGPLAILLEDRGQGKTKDDAYVNNTHGYLYILLAGDEFNLLVSAAGTSTGDAQAVGDLYIVDDGTGLLVATTGTPESEPFMCATAVSDVVAAGTLVHVIYTGY